MGVKLKRYSVQLDCHIVAVFDTLKEATQWLNDKWAIAYATVWDHYENRVVYTEVRL